MVYLFEIRDKNNKEIHLSEERWIHINKRHPEICDIETIKDTIKNPDKIKNYSFDPQKVNFYKYSKLTKDFTLVVVKYLNGKGFIITVYKSKKIK